MTVLAASSSLELALIAVLPIVIAIVVVALSLLGDDPAADDRLQPAVVPVEQRPRRPETH